MANRLYEEGDIQAIANAIRTKNGGSTTYTVSEMANAILSISSDGGENSCSHTVKQYTGTINETTIGSGTYAVLVTDSWLAEHRNDPGLFVMVEFDIEPTVYTVRKSYGGVDYNTHVMNQDQCTLRWDGSANAGKGTVSYGVNDDTNITESVGRIFISPEGELRVYANSNNYGIRPCNFTITIMGYIE